MSVLVQTKMDTNNDVIIDGEETYCYNERNELTMYER